MAKTPELPRQRAGWIPGLGISSLMPQLRVRMLQLRIPHGMTKTEDPVCTAKASTAKLKQANQQRKHLTNIGGISTTSQPSLPSTTVNTKLTEGILPAQRTLTSVQSMREIQEKKMS